MESGYNDDIHFMTIHSDFCEVELTGNFDYETLTQSMTNIIASQLPVSDWYGLFKNELIAEACLDRIIHKAIRFQLKGESLRKKY